VITDFDPFKNRRPSQSLYDKLQRFSETNESGDAIVDFLLKTLNSSLVGAPIKRNLMIVEIESLERGLLGVYNPKWRKLTPFLSEFVRRGTFFPHVVSQPYTTWSVASMFAVQCNLPLLLHRAVRRAQGEFHLLPGLHCIGDFLSRVGYRMISYQTSVFVGKFKEHMEMHQYETHDFKDHGFRRDWDLFRQLSTSVFEALAKEERPFVLHIANTDTHPTPSFTVDSRCKKRFSNWAPAIVRSYDCLDQILERFFQAFEDSPLFQTTDLILYGDHILMEGNEKKIKLPKPRSLVLCFPYRERRVIAKRVTLYDLAPTIMQLLGVKYEPQFPFGADLFSADVGTPPSLEDFQTLHDMVTAQMGWQGSVTCRGKKGFCREARS
jgi:arylsulfatase A-like enzyme